MHLHTQPVSKKRPLFSFLTGLFLSLCLLAPHIGFSQTHYHITVVKPGDVTVGSTKSTPFEPMKCDNAQVEVVATKEINWISDRESNQPVKLLDIDKRTALWKVYDMWGEDLRVWVLWLEDREQKAFYKLTKFHVFQEDPVASLNKNAIHVEGLYEVKVEQDPVTGEFKAPGPDEVSKKFTQDIHVVGLEKGKLRYQSLLCKK